MARFDFKCGECGQTFERRVTGAPAALICECGGEARRQFAVTQHILVPAHFRLLARWCLPDREDKAAWEARESGSQRHAPREESLVKHLESDPQVREALRA